MEVVVDSRIRARPRPHLPHITRHNGCWQVIGCKRKVLLAYALGWAHHLDAYGNVIPYKPPAA